MESIFQISSKTIMNESIVEIEMPVKELSIRLM